MLRSALCAAVFFIPSAATPDQMLHPEGDGTIKVQASAVAPSDTFPAAIRDALADVSSVGSAASTPATGLPNAAPAFDIRKEFDGYYAKVPGSE